MPCECILEGQAAVLGRFGRQALWSMLVLLKLQRLHTHVHEHVAYTALLSDPAAAACMTPLHMHMHVVATEKVQATFEVPLQRCTEAAASVLTSPMRAFTSMVWLMHWLSKHQVDAETMRQTLRLQVSLALCVWHAGHHAAWCTETCVLVTQ